VYLTGRGHGAGGGLAERPVLSLGAALIAGAVVGGVLAKL
jgi:hypothetical protein